MKPTVLSVVGFLVFAAIVGEAKSNPPISVSPDFDPTQIQRIDVFVVDLNNDSANNRECILGAEIGRFNGGLGACRTLDKRGYNKDEPVKGHGKDKHWGTRVYKAPITLSNAMLSNPSKAWLQDLTDPKYFQDLKIPPPGRWIMIITLDELGSRENALKGLGGAALSMYLYDRDNGTLLWHDQATKEHMWGGLLGNIWHKGDVKQDACATLTQSMIMKLPKHKK